MSNVLAILPGSTAENERFHFVTSFKNLFEKLTSENRLKDLTLLHLYRNLTPAVESILDKMAGKQRKLDINL